MEDSQIETAIKIQKEAYKQALKDILAEVGLWSIKGIDPFILFTTYGFPIELTEELAKEKGQKIDVEDFHKKMAEHQKQLNLICYHNLNYHNLYLDFLFLFHDNFYI